MTQNIFTLVFVPVPMQYSLHVAAGQGDLNAVKTLIERGADINSKDDNEVSIREISKNKPIFSSLTGSFSLLSVLQIRVFFYICERAYQTCR